MPLICEDNPCVNGGLCIEKYFPNFGCDCPDGYDGTLCENVAKEKKIIAVIAGVPISIITIIIIVVFLICRRIKRERKLYKPYSRTVSIKPLKDSDETTPFLIKGTDVGYDAVDSSAISKVESASSDDEVDNSVTHLPTLNASPELDRKAFTTLPSIDDEGTVESASSDDEGEKIDLSFVKQLRPHCTFDQMAVRSFDRIPFFNVNNKQFEFIRHSLEHIEIIAQIRFDRYKCEFSSDKYFLYILTNGDKSFQRDDEVNFLNAKSPANILYTCKVFKDSDDDDSYSIASNESDEEFTKNFEQIKTNIIQNGSISFKIPSYSAYEAEINITDKEL